MGNIGDLIVKAFIKYVESHPDVIEKLVESMVNKLIEELKKTTS